ncbi:MAG: PAS domain-containing protein [Planctomycetes bacterium]|nr:PAS domain-containing protein [Planctomycetota bacterium]
MVSKSRNDRRVNPEFSGRRRPQFPWAVSFIALGVISFIFFSYEFVERMWLNEVAASTLHLLHIIRGIGTSIIVAFLVGWYILRKGGSIFPRTKIEPIELRREEHISRHRVIHFNIWFVKMRWLACIVSIALIVITIKILGYLEERVFWPLLISVAFLVVSNLIYTFLLQRRLLTLYLREIQTVSDLVILTVMLHYSGGIENPLFLTYIFHVIIGGILLDRRKCYAIVIIATLLFTAMAFLEMSEVIDHYTLAIFPHEDEGEEIAHAAHKILYVSSIVGLQFIIMSLTAYFTTSITDRLRSEERHARVIGQRLKRVLQASGAGFTILDRHLRPLWLNNQIRKWLGLTGSTPKQASHILAKWIGGDKGPAVKTFKDGQIRVVERQRISSDGNKYIFQVTVAPIVENNGDVYQVVELVQDVTEQKLLEAEMMHSSKMAALGVMAAGVAHEIGNPLASISTRLRLLEEVHDEGFLQESIKLLEKEIDRISSILHGVSQIARPGKSQWSSCDINLIINETLDMLRLDRHVTNCRIESDLDDAMLQTTGSRDELLQMFLNLGLNALEKMPQGGALSVRTKVIRGEIKVSFSDTGEGMSEEVVAKIFTPFFSTKQQGLGLGLYIAYNIINAHDGRIEVKSKVGVGTIITVILPVRSAKMQSDTTET